MTDWAEELFKHTYPGDYFRMKHPEYYVVTRKNSPGAFERCDNCDKRGICSSKADKKYYPHIYMKECPICHGTKWKRKYVAP